ncbi:MAG: metal-dependent hydrolase [Methanocella sp.]
MDSLTHALAISAVFAIAGQPELIPFAALGAIAPDIDITFQRFSDRDPRLYIFTHGGITHSIAGAIAVSLLVALIALPAATLIGYSTPLLFAVAAIMTGALSHILLDFLAYPGIPLLYPATDKKFTIGIAAGPTPWLLVASITFGAFILTGRAGIENPWIYVGFFSLVIAMSGALKVYVSVRSGGSAIPGFNPLRWLIIEESPCAYRVYAYHLLKGRQPATDYKKYRDVPEAEVRRLMTFPEARRMRYHSYIVTASRAGNGIELSDPLRQNGYLWYPPYFKSLLIANAKH